MVLKGAAIGIDLGTSEVKVVLLGSAGEVLASAGAPVPRPTAPRPGWSEQRPADWWAAACTALAALRQAEPAAWQAVRAIGLSGQMHGPVLLDRNDEVLRPAILWNDARAVRECAAIEAGHPDLARIVGSRVMPGLAAPKLRWLATHEPDVMARLDCVLMPKDHIGLRLTGRRFTDPSDAAGSGWFDIAQRTWHAPALAASGLRLSQLPPVHESGQAVGTLRPEVARQLGLSADVVVAAGGGDTPVSALGIGVVDESQAFISLGTSGVLFVARNRPVLAPQQLLHGYGHVLPDRWYQMAAMLSGASCLRWAANLTGLPEHVLTEQARERFPEHAAAPTEAPLFLPYLAGERTPHNDADARGLLTGLTHASGPAQLAYAVMEGVGFGLLDGLEAIRQNGAGPPEIVLVGGGSRSAYWAELLANILATDIVLVHRGDLGAAVGAARLGLMAAGAPLQAVVRPSAVAARFLPRVRSVAALRVRHGLFKAAYRHNAALFKQVAAAAGDGAAPDH